MKAKPVPVGRHRGQQLVGPLRDGSDRQGHRREVPPRHLRRRQPRGGVHGVRRNRGDDATRARAGRDDQGQALAAAGGGGRSAADHRGLRHRFRRSRSSSRILQGDRPASASSFRRVCRPKWWRRSRSCGSRRSAKSDAEEVRRQRARCSRRWYGEEAYDAVWPTSSSNAYLLQDAGLAKVSPESVGFTPLRRTATRPSWPCARTKVRRGPCALDGSDSKPAPSRDDPPDSRGLLGRCSARLIVHRVVAHGPARDAGIPGFARRG